MRCVYIYKYVRVCVCVCSVHYCKMFYVICCLCGASSCLRSVSVSVPVAQRSGSGSGSERLDYRRVNIGSDSEGREEEADMDTCECGAYNREEKSRMEWSGMQWNSSALGLCSAVGRRTSESELLAAQHSSAQKQTQRGRRERIEALEARARLQISESSRVDRSVPSRFVSSHSHTHRDNDRDTWQCHYHFANAIMYSRIRVCRNQPAGGRRPGGRQRRGGRTGTASSGGPSSGKGATATCRS